MPLIRKTPIRVINIPSIFPYENFSSPLIKTTSVVRIGIEAHKDVDIARSELVERVDQEEGESGAELLDGEVHKEFPSVVQTTPRTDS